jgi:uncharacterized coiled-coil protein SlyX
MTAGPNDDSSRRLMVIEERMAFLEQQFEQLSDVVVDQGRELDTISRELTRSRGVIQQLLAGDRGEDLPHEKPPHY